MDVCNIYAFLLRNDPSPFSDTLQVFICEWLAILPVGLIVLPWELGGGTNKQSDKYIEWKYKRIEICLLVLVQKLNNLKNKTWVLHIIISYYY